MLLPCACACPTRRECRDTPPATRASWIASQLAAVDRAATPWLVVAAHRPMYADTPDDGDVAVAGLMLEHLEPMFAAAQVDVVLSGHVHTYSRSCPVLKGTCVDADGADGTARGPVHLLFGHGGARACSSGCPARQHGSD